MSERKVKEAIFAQRDAPRRARVSWIPQSHKSPPSKARPGVADAAPRESAPASHEPPAPTQSSPQPPPSSVHESSDVAPASARAANDLSSAEPPPTMRGFFDELPEIPPPPELTTPTTSAQAAIESFVQAAEALSEIRALRHSRVERDLVELAGAIAERVLGRELLMDPTLLAALARDGILALADRESVTVRFSTDTPDDAKTLLLEAVTNRTPGCKVVFDRELVAGSCVVESAQGFVDESVTTRLDIVMEQLGFGGGGLT